MWKKYQIIYADPPWQYHEGRIWVDGSAEAEYPTMSIEELEKLPIKDLADKNCVLFMWVTFPMLKEGLDLMESWGFKYKTCGFCWIKTNPKSGTVFKGLDGELTSKNFSCVILKSRSISRYLLLVKM
jgi:N6-adenosine-specific RNA methylase IME4